jgi:hypothetical protein
MNKTLLTLLFTTSIAFADDHATTAIDQIEFAIKAGNSGELSKQNMTLSH